jgi:hypothetical protein
VTTVINVQSVAQGGCVVVEVYDHAQGGPFLRDLGREWQTVDSGRGMWLVDSVTRGAWRWEPSATGKVVVAVITGPLPEALPHGHSALRISFSSLVPRVWPLYAA